MEAESIQLLNRIVTPSVVAIVSTNATQSTIATLTNNSNVDNNYQSRIWLNSSCDSKNHGLHPRYRYYYDHFMSID